MLNIIKIILRVVLLSLYKANDYQSLSQPRTHTVSRLNETASAKVDR